MNSHQGRDEALIIDYLLGQCDEQSHREVRSRLEREETFRKLHEDISNTFAALRLAPEPVCPDDLVDRTLARLRQVRQTEALLARQEIAQRASRPVFSLKELTAVAVSLFLLASIFIPSMYYGRSRRLRSACAAQLGGIGTAFHAYAAANDGFLPNSSIRNTRWLANGTTPAASNSMGLFKLLSQGYVASPRQFQCPAVGGESFVVEAGMVDFPSGGHISYSYQHMLGPEGLSRNDPDVAAVADRMAVLADSTPVFDSRHFFAERVRASASPSHSGRGQNVLYLSGLVRWCQEATAGVADNNIYLAEGIYEYHGDEAPTNDTDSFLLPAYSAAETDR